MDWEDTSQASTMFASWSITWCLKTLRSDYDGEENKRGFKIKKVENDRRNES